MKTIKEIISQSLSVLGLVFLGILVGWGLGYITLSLHGEGLFSTWKLLSSEKQFERINDAGSQWVWATVESGQNYILDSNCNREAGCNTWSPMEAIPENLLHPGDTILERRTSCDNFPNGFFFLRNPPSEVIECSRVLHAGPEFGSVTYYALVEDGSIWRWEFNSSIIIRFVVYIFFILIGVFLGFIFIGLRLKQLGIKLQ